jgi:hypothetical protein
MMQRHNFWSILLIVLLVALAGGGFYGGISFLIDPLQQNNTMNVPLSMLDGLFIHDFVLPGLFLLAVMGILPLLAAFGLAFRPAWHWTDPLNGWTHRHWSWTLACAVAVLLVLWLGFEIALMGTHLYPPQIGTGILGIWLLILVWLPPLQRLYHQ